MPNNFAKFSSLCAATLTGLQSPTGSPSPVNRYSAAEVVEVVVERRGRAGLAEIAGEAVPELGCDIFSSNVLANATLGRGRER